MLVASGDIQDLNLPVTDLGLFVVFVTMTRFHMVTGTAMQIGAGTAFFIPCVPTLVSRGEETFRVLLPVTEKKRGTGQRPRRPINDGPSCLRNDSGVAS